MNSLVHSTSAAAPVADAHEQEVLIAAGRLPQGGMAAKAASRWQLSEGKSSGDGMRLADVQKALDGIAPPQHAEAWDNVGLLVGAPEQRVR